MTRHDGLEQIGKICSQNELCVFGVELRDEWSRTPQPVYICSILPTVVFVAVALPLNEVLQSSTEHATVDYRFNFILLFSVDQNGIWRWVTPTSGDRVRRCSQQFDHWEDGVEAAHGLQ